MQLLLIVNSPFHFKKRNQNYELDDLIFSHLLTVLLAALLTPGGRNTIPSHPLILKKIMLKKD